MRRGRTAAWSSSGSALGRSTVSCATVLRPSASRCRRGRCGRSRTPARVEGRQRRGRRVAVGVARPPRSRRSPGRRRSSTSGSPGSELPWCGTFIASTSGRSSGSSASLSASADSKRSNAPELTIATTPRAGSGPPAAAPGGAEAARGPGSSGRPARSVIGATAGTVGCRGVGLVASSGWKPGSRVAVAAVEQQADRSRPSTSASPPWWSRERAWPPRARAAAHPPARAVADPALRRARRRTDRGPVRVLDERGVALADVEEPHREVARRRRRAEAGRRREREHCEHEHEHGDAEGSAARAARRRPARRSRAAGCAAGGARPSASRGAERGDQQRRRRPRARRIERQREPAARQSAQRSASRSR